VLRRPLPWFVAQFDGDPPIYVKIVDLPFVLDPEWLEHVTAIAWRWALRTNVVVLDPVRTHTVPAEVLDGTEAGRHHLRILVSWGTPPQIPIATGFPS
jgi:hypothetical protein